MNEGLEENKCRMKAFLEATKELYAGKKKKGCGVLNGTEEHTDKTWKEEGMPYNATRPHARFKEPVRNTEKSTRVKDRVEMMDLLRRIAFVAEGKGRDNGRLTGQKAAEFSQPFI